MNKSVAAMKGSQGGIHETVVLDELIYEGDDYLNYVL